MRDALPGAGRAGPRLGQNVGLALAIALLAASLVVYCAIFYAPSSAFPAVSS